MISDIIITQSLYMDKEQLLVC